MADSALNLDNSVIPINFARKYAALGWPVLPLFPASAGACGCGKKNCQSAGKHPLTQHGMKDASKASQMIETWWSKHPTANVGIQTGVNSGLVVIDVDKRDGGIELWDKLTRSNGHGPTLCSLTGGGGKHVLFKHPGQPIISRVNLFSGIDVRADGAYIVAPPSRHVSGSIYRWEQHSSAGISEMPAWLLELLLHKYHPTEKELDQSSDEVYHSALGQGTRNSVLTRVAGLLRKQGLGQTHLEKALQALNSAVCLPPLEQTETRSIARSISAYPTGEVWTSPQPLLSHKTQVQCMSNDMVPVAWRDWALDTSERMQCSLDLLIPPALVAAASLIGRKVSIAPKARDTWKVTPNLWGAVVAPPGSMKSPAMNQGMACIYKLAKLAYKKNSVQASRRYFTSDATVEKLLAIIKDNPNGILLVRDELSGWLESMNKGGREGDREFYLEAWNGDSPYAMDRIGRGSIHVDALCLSVFGTIQPSKLQKHLQDLNKSSLLNDGLIQRFQILVKPQLPREWHYVDREPDLKAQVEMERSFERLDALPLLPESRIVRFCKNSQEVFDVWRKGLEERLLCKHFSPLMESHTSKYRSLFPSLALVFQLIDSLEVPSMDVGLSATIMAKKWVWYLESHATQIYRENSKVDCKATTALARKILEERICDGDSVRDIYRNCWRDLKDVNDVSTAIENLKALNWLRSIRRYQPGRPTERFEINPELVKNKSLWLKSLDEV